MTTVCNPGCHTKRDRQSSVNPDNDSQTSRLLSVLQVGCCQSSPSHEVFTAEEARNQPCELPVRESRLVFILELRYTSFSGINFNYHATMRTNNKIIHPRLGYRLVVALSNKKILVSHLPVHLCYHRVC